MRVFVFAIHTVRARDVCVTLLRVCFWIIMYCECVHSMCVLFCAYLLFALHRLCTVFACVKYRLCVSDILHVFVSVIHALRTMRRM